MAASRRCCRDSGLESAAELRSALEQLRAVVPDEAPAPRADLAALLAAGAAGPAAPVSAATTATTALPTCRVRDGSHRRGAAGRGHEPRRAPRPEASAGNRGRRRDRCDEPGSRRRGGIQRGLPRTASARLSASSSSPRGRPLRRRKQGQQPPDSAAPRPSNAAVSTAQPTADAVPQLRIRARRSRLSPAPHRPPSAAAASCRHPARGPVRRVLPGLGTAETAAKETGATARSRSRSQPFPSASPPLPAR